MIGLVSFTVCLAMAAVNVALYASMGSEWNLASAIFCGGLAIYVALLGFAGRPR